MDIPCSVTSDLNAYMRQQEDMIPSVYNRALDQAEATLIAEALHDPDWISEALTETEVIESVMNLLNGLEAGREHEQIAGLGHLIESAVRKQLVRYLAENIDERACEIYSQVLNSGEK